MQTLLVSVIVAISEHSVLIPFLFSLLCRVLGSLLNSYTTPSTFFSRLRTLLGSYFHADALILSLVS